MTNRAVKIRTCCGLVRALAACKIYPAETVFAKEKMLEAIRKNFETEDECSPCSAASQFAALAAAEEGRAKSLQLRDAFGEARLCVVRSGQLGSMVRGKF